MKRILYCAIIAVTLGAIVGGGMLWIAFQENPQQIFFDQRTGTIHYGPSLSVFFSWFVVVSVVVAMAELAVYVLGRLARIWK